MKKLAFAVILLAVGTNYASACLFDSDFDKCMKQCTASGDILYPICAIGASAPHNNSSH
ncbi:hypothetical protein C7374_101349 [Falsochrobactrum ovis]|uniref:Uncharacterized protein n=1 Tax=Falsochrobactrum ovis TaxID=1293442 RepID=A0A364JZN5_9HYPH|nr:hypothetical protein C7374_101349 [Falsochrobactrum ovis]